MALQQWHCLDCDKDFKAGEYVCQTGLNHRVNSRRYFMDDAPSVPCRRDGVMMIDKHSATLVMNIPPEKRAPDGTVIPGGTAQFVRGMYETEDPEKQFWLDQHKGMCTEERWKEVYFNETEKFQLEKMELAAERSRLEVMSSNLLERVQARK